MTTELTQSQASEPLVFLLIDSALHIAGKTGAAPTVTISKNGAGFAAPAGAVTEIANGWYKVAPDVTDTDTLGPLILHATAAGADPVDLLFQVVKQNRRTASMDLVLAKTTNITGFNDIAATAVVSSGPITTNGGAVSTATTVGTVSNGVTLADDAITAAKYDEATAFPVRADDAGVTQIARVGADSDTLETLSDQIDTVTGFGAPPAMITAQEVRDAMKLDATALPAPVAGSVDAHLNDLLTDTGNLISRLGAFLGTTTNTVYGWLRAMMRKDVAAPTDIGGTFDPATDSEEGLRDTLPTDSTIADQVWNEAIGGHLGVGSTGESLNTAGSAGDPWHTALPGAYPAGDAGYILNQILTCSCGGGSVVFVYTLTDSGTGLPIAGALVWVTTDVAGVNVVASGYTDALGKVQFMLSPGNAYFWRQKGGYTFANPDLEVVV